MTRSHLVLTLALAVVAACACVVSVVGLRRPGPAVPTAAAAEVRPVAAPVAAAVAAPVETEPSAAEVLAAWDDARAAAWARGDPAALAALYVPGSRAGRRDAAMLAAWTGRGLVVESTSTQLLAVEEVARAPDRWSLRVTDRLVGAVAVGAGTRRPLPADAATTRVVELCQVDGAWRVATSRVAGGGASGVG